MKLKFVIATSVLAALGVLPTWNAAQAQVVIAPPVYRVPIPTLVPPTQATNSALNPRLPATLFQSVNTSYMGAAALGVAGQQLGQIGQGGQAGQLGQGGQVGQLGQVGQVGQIGQGGQQGQFGQQGGGQLGQQGGIGGKQGGGGQFGQQGGGGQFGQIGQGGQFGSRYGI